MPATSACPICGGALSNEELRQYKFIVFCDNGAVDLSPAEATIVKALLGSPGGLGTVAGILPRSVWEIGVNRLGQKLQDIGWAVVNIGPGRGGLALYVIRREERRC